MWILDLLLDYFAGARIMLYGCPVNAGGNNSSSVVKALAGGLIASLNDLSDDVECQASGPIDATSRNVPLIFIGYSLAGQVIKQVIYPLHKQWQGAHKYTGDGDYSKATRGCQTLQIRLRSTIFRRSEPSNGA